MNRLTSLLAFLPVTLLAGACTVESSNPTPHSVVVTEPTDPIVSTLVIDWTIAETKDPNECSKSLSGTIEISIDDASGGTEIAAYHQSCSAFSTSITLGPGTYSAVATLLDGSGIPRTTDLPIAPFTLRGNDSLTIPIDFPSDSFLSDFQ